MLMAFFDWQGLVYQHFFPRDIRIDRWYYLKVLQKVHEYVAKKRPHFKKGWVLHHYNAQPRVAKEVTAFLLKHNIEVMVHPPYSPDLTPCDFWLFPRLKTVLRRRRFKKYSELLNAVQTPQCQSKGRFPENLPLVLGTTATGLHCQQWPLF